MIELTICGRGGQGGVTLAKLIATAAFQRGQFSQAFGVYAAERSGAPLAAYVRIDDCEITNHNQVRQPDHVIVLDKTLVGPQVLAGLKPDGWIIVNTAGAPSDLSPCFAGWHVATVDATAIAVANKLGTRAVPIVNTTMLGAVARVLDMDWNQIVAALQSARFSDANTAAARAAHEAVQMTLLPGPRATPCGAKAPFAPLSLLDENVGAPPTIRTGAWATRRPHREQLTPPCVAACPAGNDVRSFVAELGKNNVDGALSILLESSPLPGVCGRVCPAPCMQRCNRNPFDESVQVRELERYAAEHGRRPAPTQPWRASRVAVVGSGPAGLSATYHLARLGHRVSVFESRDELGGLLRTGIPAYRLPRDVLDEEISHILRHGVKAHLGYQADRAALLELSRRHDAVFVATGLQELRGLDLGPRADGFVMQGVDFLDRARRFDVAVRGERVVVIGGGNTAVDAARSALRLGAHPVRIFYRRTRAEMPAIGEEIDEALDEGVELHELVAPLTLRPDNGEAVLTCARFTLGEPDQTGRPRPIPLTSEDAQFDIRCDRVILAMGQGADISLLPEGAEVRKDGALAGWAGAPLYFGGDFATNDGTVAAAIGSGQRAAWHIHRALTGEDLFPPAHQPIASAEFIHWSHFSHDPAHHAPHAPTRERRRTFVEVRQSLSDDPGHHVAAEEAARCLSCGVCNLCDQCVEHCPEGVLRRDGACFRFDFDYCKGCGVCASQCPRGVIHMAEL